MPEYQNVELESLKSRMLLLTLPSHELGEQELV